MTWLDATGWNDSASGPAFSLVPSASIASFRACSSAFLRRAFVSAPLMAVSCCDTIPCRSSQLAATMSCDFLKSKSACPLSSSFFSRSASCCSSQSDALAVVVLRTESVSAM